MNIIERIFRAFRKESDTINPSAWFPFGKESSKRQLQDLYYGIVYSCIDAIATGVATTEPQLFLDDKDGTPNEIFDDPILAPLKKANRFQSGSDVLYVVSSHIDAYGMSYLWPRKNLQGYPIELYALNPLNIKQVTSRSEFPEQVVGYVYQQGTVRVPFAVEDLIPIYRPNPFNQRAGVSTIEMARLEAEADLNAQEYNKAFFDRGAKPSGILTTEEKIDDSVFERLKKQWESENESKSAWRKTLVLEQGLTYQQLSLNQKDMDFVKQRTLSRDDIMAIFKVPKSILAISDDVNRSNAESGEYVFAKYTKLPRLQMIYEKLNAFYVPLFPQATQKFLSFENPVPEDVTTVVAAREKAIYKWKTVNEIRAEDKLDGIGPDGDKLYIPLNLMPIDEPFDHGDDGEDENEPSGEADKPKEDDKKKKPEEKPKKGLQKSLELLVKAKKSERAFVMNRRKYLDKRQAQLNIATRQLYADLIKEVKRNKAVKAEGDNSVEFVLSQIIPNFDKFKSLAASVFLRYATETFTQGLKDVENYFEFTINYDLIHTGATAYLRDRANYTANSVRDSMLNKARDVIAVEMEKPGFTLAKARAEVLKIFSEEASWRSMRIAKTETNNAYANANFRAYRDSGVVEKIKWSTNDPCELCEPNDGVVREIGITFPSGDAHEPVHPNCECLTLPYFGI